VFAAATTWLRKLENRDVRIRNSDAQRHPNLQLSLVIQKKMARIQAAGVNGFVKGSTEIMVDAQDKTGGTCAEAVAHNSFSNSDRRTEDDG
jgi:hypothetical protein